MKHSDKARVKPYSKKPKSAVKFASGSRRASVGSPIVSTNTSFTNDVSKVSRRDLTKSSNNPLSDFNPKGSTSSIKLQPHHLPTTMTTQSPERASCLMKFKRRSNSSALKPAIKSQLKANFDKLSRTQAKENMGNHLFSTFENPVQTPTDSV